MVADFKGTTKKNRQQNIESLEQCDEKENKNKI